MKRLIFIFLLLPFLGCEPDDTVQPSNYTAPAPKPAPVVVKPPQSYAKIKCSSCRVEFFTNVVVGNFYPNGVFINIENMPRPANVWLNLKDGVKEDKVDYTFYKNGQPYAGGSLTLSDVNTNAKRQVVYY